VFIVSSETHGKYTTTLEQTHFSLSDYSNAMQNALLTSKALTDVTPTTSVSLI